MIPFQCINIINMTGLTKGVIVSALLCSAVSCINVHKYFGLHKSQPVDGTSRPLLTKGVFINKIIDLHGHYRMIYLYQDGSVIMATYVLQNVDEVEFWSNAQKYIDKELDELQRVHPNWNHSVGHYIVRNDSIHIQYFITQDQYRVKHNSIDLYGKIKDKTTFALTKRECDWCNNSSNIREKTGLLDQFISQEEYKFYVSNSKPDSSDIWFKEKSWYKKSMWYK
jgi:hypothetical protein